jgi:hypothetical protein
MLARADGASHVGGACSTRQSRPRLAALGSTGLSPSHAANLTTVPESAGWAIIVDSDMNVACLRRNATDVALRRRRGLARLGQLLAS